MAPKQSKKVGLNNWESRNIKVGPADYQTLSGLGLSKLAIACYQSLFEDGGASAEQLAEKLERPRAGLYRVLKEMETLGFITRHKASVQDVCFYAQPLESALADLWKYQRRQVRDVVKYQALVLAKRRSAAS